MVVFLNLGSFFLHVIANDLLKILKIYESFFSNIFQFKLSVTRLILSKLHLLENNGTPRELDGS